MDDVEMTDATGVQTAIVESDTGKSSSAFPVDRDDDDDDGLHEDAAKPVATTSPSTTDVMATATTTSSLVMPQSKVPDIWSYFLHKLDRIDDLERRIVERTKQFRRRILNGLEQRQVWQKHRRSHVRLFVSHDFDKKTGVWTLAIEGRLLIGNLDHQSAAVVDRDGVMSQRLAISEETTKEDEAIDNEADDRTESESKGTTPPPSKKTKLIESKEKGNEETPSLAPATVRARAAAARHPHAIDHEPKVQPLLFTHMFDMLEVTFRTIYQPKSSSLEGAPMEKKPTSKKKQKKGKKTTILQDGIDPKDLRASEPVKVEWYRTGKPPTNKNKDDHSVAEPTPDSHSFFIKYNNHFSERPPPPNMKFYNVVADIKLYPKRPPSDDDREAFFQVSKILAEKFFPYHSTEGGTQRHDEKSDDLPGEATSVDPHQKGKQPGLGSGATATPIPIENAVHVPALLTYNEISSAIFLYIQEHKLFDSSESDKSYIQCDKILQDIFEVESMSFSELKNVLLEKGLITRVHTYEEPVVVTYIMDELSTSKMTPDDFENVLPSTMLPESLADTKSETATESSSAEEPEGHPSIISFDIDVSIPSLYNSRAREFLQRGKCREFDYTTTRLKAHRLLSSCKINEEALKIKMDRCVSRQGYAGSANVPIFQALAKSAPPDSEVEMAAKIDTRTCDLVERIQTTSCLANSAWEAVYAARSALTVPSGTASTIPEKSGNGHDEEHSDEANNDGEGEREQEDDAMDES